MGDLRSGNGGTPDDNGRHSHDPLPDFPAEWGPVIIPDDPSELDADRRALLRERRRIARRNRLRALTGRPPLPGGPAEQQSLGVPMLVMAVAVLITLVSLFVVTWIRGPANTLGVPSTNRRTDSTSAATDLNEINLTDTVGAPVRLGTVLPAVILLVDGCSCGTLVNELAHQVPATVTVVAVGHSVPSGTAVAANVRPLADPTGALTARFPHDARSGSATAVLLDKSAAVKDTVSTVKSAGDIPSAELAQLATH